MFAKVMCPACQHKFSIPEGDMGKRHVCPNCQSPFVAGKYVADGDAPKLKPAAAPAPAPAAAGMNKTMLGETGPAIKYNCPRCKKALESPSIEGGTKKACPECGQRLQVPAAPPSAAPPEAGPNINKTILASEENCKATPAAGTNKTMLVADEPPLYYNCPRCKKPLESATIEAGTKKPCPECGQRLQVPAKSTRKPNQTMLGEAQTTGSSAGGTSTVPSSQTTAAGGSVSTRTLGMVGGGLGVLILLVLLACVVPAVIRGGKSEDLAAIAQAKQELLKIKEDIDRTKAQMEQQKKFEDEQSRKWKTMMENQERIKFEWEQAQRNATDEAAKAAAKKRIDEKQRELEKAQQDALNQQNIVKAQIDALQAQIKAANDRQQVIIQQPAPTVYYPPYHPRYYSPWGWGW